MNEVERDCGNVSELSIVYNHPSYKKIIENGTYSIPHLLEKLDSNTCMFWIKSLQDITGESPDKDVRKTSDIRDSWKKWSKENGY